MAVITPQTLIVPVPNITEVMEEFNRLRIYRGAGPSGPFSTLVDTITLVAGTRSYTTTDDAAASSWYVNEFYDTVSGDTSPQSPPYPADAGEVTTLRQLVRDTAERCGLLRPPRRQRTTPTGACGTLTTGSDANTVTLMLRSGVWYELARSVNG